MKVAELKTTLNQYGFVEVSELLFNISSVEDEVISSFDARYVYDRLCYCLERHGSSSDYFDPIRKLIVKLRLDYWVCSDNKWMYGQI